ncbi:hypothetical protein T11_15705 [Trichinella zimbabwensis]|uniref:Uncharacterized protein n=1 Tax=Trichinella zimbabwensis TaxID=268475 RepID=A0A0V1HL15_9BILA|nr:hypothetical protein T11_15705 [Trichinella zimbabwensis]
MAPTALIPKVNTLTSRNNGKMHKEKQKAKRSWFIARVQYLCDFKSSNLKAHQKASCQDRMELTPAQKTERNGCRFSSIALIQNKSYMIPKDNCV